MSANGASRRRLTRSTAGLAGKVAVSGAGGFSGFPSGSNYNALARGVQTVDVWQDYRQLGRTAAEAAVALCRDPDIAKVSGTTRFATPGENQLTSILLTSTTITQDNLSVILDTGWIKKDDLCRDGTRPPRPRLGVVPVGPRRASCYPGRPSRLGAG